MHGRDNSRMGTTLERRGGGDDAFDARDFRGDDAHMGRGDHGIFSAGHVAANRVHRDILVPEDDTRKRFDLDVLQRRLLVLGEVAYLVLGKADVLEIAGCDLRDSGLDLVLRKAKCLRRPVVEFPGEVAHGRIAPGIDVGENALDDLTHLGVVFRPLVLRLSPFQILGHC